MLIGYFTQVCLSESHSVVNTRMHPRHNGWPSSCRSKNLEVLSFRALATHGQEGLVFRTLATDTYLFPEFYQYDMASFTG